VQSGWPAPATAQAPSPDTPPTAAFSFAPATPVAGETVTFTSQSTDPEGPVAEVWDLDGDGVFADATGPVATSAFTAGRHLVQLRVVDAAQTESITSLAVDIAATGRIRGSLLTPFPIVRIVGTASGSSTLLKLMTITAPQTATATVRCRGRGCPFARRTQQMTSAKRGSGPRGTRTLRIHTFDGEPLGHLAQIQVFVTDALQRGKYTRFTMRRGKAPVRADSCTGVARAVVIRCPRTAGGKP
jgi:hypothetical protein